jgi:N4-gp56 family major capsid protein
MSDITVVSGSVAQVWDDQFFAEYVRENKFAKVMGTDEAAIIQIKEQLGKAAGDKINIPLIGQLTGAGVTGDTALWGSEEALANWNHQLTVNQLRNGVRMGKMEEQKTTIDLRNAARQMLKKWAMDKMRDDIIGALYSPVVDGKTLYASATEGQKDTWVTAQAAANRVLFGAAKSNYSAADHSASLTNLDGTNDKLTHLNVSLMKRMLMTSSSPVTPYRTEDGKEYFVLFAGSLPFRDLKADTTIIAANEYAGVRGDKNLLFDDGDILWDGVIVKEIPEIGVIANAGDGGNTNVAANFMCGAQALGLAWAQRTKTITDSFDYDNLFGVAISEIRGVEKLTYNSIQHGVGTLYTTAVADS